MRRWNGWGDDSISYPLPESSIPKLIEWVGPSTPLLDATLQQVIKAVPDSRLPDHPLVTTDREERIRHARGQSLPDWVAVRSGHIDRFPDGVAYPDTEDGVQELVRWAVQQDVVLIPYGGGTSVVGHINPAPSGRPVLTVDLKRLNQLYDLDKTSYLASFGAGVQGPDLEARLGAQGFTLGHFPQSFEYSSLGGWVASRSTGQQSYRYGRIERMFAGGRVQCPAGALTMPPFPASAAGPDLRELVLGSEGRLGILTEVTVRVSPSPEQESFHALFFPEFDPGLEAVRSIVQTRLPVSMLRLSTARETATNLALAGRAQLVRLMEKGLNVLGAGEDKCMLIVGLSGQRGLVNFARRATLRIARRFHAVHVGQYMGAQWHKTRFTTPYLRNTLWEMGYAVDTLETAARWSHIPALIIDIETAIRKGLETEGEQVHVFTHISHVYTDGASIYTTFLFRRQPDPEATLAYWMRLKDAASRAIVAAGGTISHQHGVGTDHAPYLSAEKGKLGMAAVRAACSFFDPSGIMNPGKLAD
jgi:alkyldihydroxyacetonephosphate synthase